MTLRNLRRCGRCVLPLIAFATFVPARADDKAAEHPLLQVLQSELDESMTKLVAPDGTKPYFIQYAVTDFVNCSASASLGALESENRTHYRYLDVDVRVGDYTLDNTHRIRGQEVGVPARSGWAGVPVDDDPLATRYVLWSITDQQFKAAVRRLEQVRANLKVKVEEDDTSDDFSREEPSVHIGPWIDLDAPCTDLADRVRRYSRVFRDHPLIYESSVSITGNLNNCLVVNSEGSRLQYGATWWRITVSGATIAPDGMELSQNLTFDAHTRAGLPPDDVILAGIRRVIDDVLALRQAPLIEPYTGPAILLNRASGVFFHEIFGHRIEGHRQKDVEEGQTFAKKIGQPVLPDFITVLDDPSLRTFGSVDLNGFYEFDEECVPAQRTLLVENGILRNFLLSRSPTRGFTKSNGHGRASTGLRVVARQGNLIVESARQVPFTQLREKLLEECRRQGKDYGLLFEDISGGFTTTTTYSPQAFKVLPVIVRRLYADGRPDELVRGVDIVGTPLTCFSKILCTGDDPDVFNGVCGAESGSIPVAAISPSILVEQIEVERREIEQDPPPILPSPIAQPAGSTTTPAPDQSQTQQQPEGTR